MKKNFALRAIFEPDQPNPLLTLILTLRVGFNPIQLLNFVLRQNAAPFLFVCTSFFLEFGRVVVFYSKLWSYQVLHNGAKQFWNSIN